MTKKKLPSLHAQYLANKHKEKKDIMAEQSTIQADNNTQPLREPNKKKVVGVVDYEHWFFGLKKHFDIKPNIKGWYEEIFQDEVREVIFFADFSREELIPELGRCRAFTNSIIDTRNPNPEYKKDYTDFIILDTLYQLNIRYPDVEKVVLVTGDGHFTSACNFLKNFCGKEVVVYGVRDRISQSLRMSASKVIEIPNNYDYLLPAAKAILNYMQETKRKKTYWYFFFSPTVTYVAENRDMPFTLVRDAMTVLIKEQYITSEKIFIDENTERNILEVDWNKVYSDGLLEIVSTKSSNLSLANAQSNYTKNGYEFTFKAVQGGKIL